MAKHEDNAQGEGKPVRKLTAKQEAFARAYIETGNASEAYRRAYDVENCKPEGIWVNACKLLKSANVSLRVEQLKAEVAERHDITVDLITDGYLEAAELARATASAQALTGAYTALAKLHGLIVDKSQNTSVTVDLNEILRAKRQGKALNAPYRNRQRKRSL